ncbi:hypothetical protein [Candidatus Acidulodesulfobacterium sp. H_13]|uniref:hypothetical protein n=1 Tax=Candidatus Acidulodesulfobacterium sp. H_13 TaxID=3395470 RepID=UPI003AF4E318
MFNLDIENEDSFKTLRLLTIPPAEFAAGGIVMLEAAKTGTTGTKLSVKIIKHKSNEKHLINDFKLSIDLI